MSPSSDVDGDGLTWTDAVNRFKRELLATALSATGGNRTHAAARLGLQRTYFLRLLQQLNVPGRTPRRPKTSPWFQ